jgi:hypothetical protein
VPGVLTKVTFEVFGKRKVKRILFRLLASSRLAPDSEPAKVVPETNSTFAAMAAKNGDDAMSMTTHCILLGGVTEHRPSSQVNDVRGVREPVIRACN